MYRSINKSPKVAVKIVQLFKNFTCIVLSSWIVNRRIRLRRGVFEAIWGNWKTKELVRRKWITLQINWRSGAYPWAKSSHRKGLKNRTARLYTRGILAQTREETGKTRSRSGTGAERSSRAANRALKRVDALRAIGARDARVATWRSWWRGLGTARGQAREYRSAEEEETRRAKRRGLYRAWTGKHVCGPTAPSAPWGSLFGRATAGVPPPMYLVTWASGEREKKRRKEKEKKGSSTKWRRRVNTSTGGLRLARQNFLHRVSRPVTLLLEMVRLRTGRRFIFDSLPIWFRGIVKSEWERLGRSESTRC